MGIEGRGSPQEPYEGFPSALGTGGLQLNKPLDQLSPQECSRLSNFDPATGELVSRPGQTELAASGIASPLHSLKRLEDPQDSTFTRFWGAGTSLLRGQAGALPVLEGGFSGNPLTFAPTRPPQSGEPWMVIADGSKVRKATRTGPSLPVGLPAPAVVPAAVVQTALVTPIAACAASDSTQASAWLGGQGDDSGAGIPTIADVVGPSGAGIQIHTDPGTASGGYLSYAYVPKALDLSHLPGPVAADDEDMIHLWLHFSTLTAIEEVRVYFLCSPIAAFPKTPLPGTRSGYNQAAYMRAFRPSDYATMVEYGTTVLDATTSVRRNQLLASYSDVKVGGLTPSGSSTPSIPIPDPSSSTLAAAGVWSEFGKIGVPLRRSDFLRLGTAGQAGTDWSTVTAIFVAIKTIGNVTGAGHAVPGSVPTGAVAVSVSLDNVYLFGGSGPDTSEPGTQRLNHRYTWFDTRTGAESNGSPIQDEALWGDAVRQAIQITPPAYGDPAIRQNIYRRGGTLVENWYYVGQTTGDGVPFVDTLADTEIDTSGANTIPVDHFQPVATQTAAGATVLAQPVPVVFGPFDNGVYCALGDPYRPGHLYACLPGEVDHWPSTGNFAVEVCPPSEELMNGGVWAGQAFVLSRERGYTVQSNLAGGEGIVVTPTGVTPGLAARWGFCVGPGGVYYVAKDGIRVTAGQDSAILSDAIRPLFLWDPADPTGPTAQPVHGYYPIDWTVPAAIRLEVHNLQLWFLYQDLLGVRRCLVYSLLLKVWTSYMFGRPVAALASEPTAQGPTLILGATDGRAYEHRGYQDGPGVTGGSPDPVIHCSARTGAWDLGRPREEKQLAEVWVQGEVPGMTLRLTTLLNEERTTNAEQTVVGLAGLRAYLFEPFGTTPQHARTVSLDLQVDAPSAGTDPGVDGTVRLRRAEVSYVFQPQITQNRSSTWESLTGDGGPEAYLIGVLFDCDTGGSDRTILIETDLAGTITTVATLTVNANGRHKLWFSWVAAHAQAVRFRPTGACEDWMVWRCQWLAQPEPPRIALFDTNWEECSGGSPDCYFTGFDLDIDTFGASKTVEARIDQVLVGTFTVTANGRRFLHFTLNTPVRGHLTRLVATDAAPCLLYSHKWMAQPEPEEHTNWNAGFTTWSSLSDKFLKGLIVEADTFGNEKTVEIQVDGATLVTLQMTHNGRSVKDYSFPQVLGRVFRVIPTDAFPSRLYNLLPLYDEEPYQLSRWEGQLSDWDLPGAGWGSFLSADICLRSTTAVTFTLYVYNANGVLISTLVHHLPSTDGEKRKLFIPAAAASKGVLTKPLFTADSAGVGFTLYQEESRVRVIPWGQSTAVSRPWWGNGDTDRTRNMVNAVIAGGKSGGGS